MPPPELNLQLSPIIRLRGEEIPDCLLIESLRNGVYQYAKATA